MRSRHQHGDEARQVEPAPPAGASAAVVARPVIDVERVDVQADAQRSVDQRTRRDHGSKLADQDDDRGAATRADSLRAPGVRPGGHDGSRPGAARSSELERDREEPRHRGFACEVRDDDSRNCQVPRHHPQSGCRVGHPGYQQSNDQSATPPGTPRAGPTAALCTPAASSSSITTWIIVRAMRPHIWSSVSIQSQGPRG